MPQISNCHRIRIPVLKHLGSSFYTFPVWIARSCDRNTFFFKTYYSVHQEHIYATCTLNMSQIYNYHRIWIKTLKQFHLSVYTFPVVLQMFVIICCYDNYLILSYNYILILCLSVCPSVRPSTFYVTCFRYI